MHTIWRPSYSTSLLIESGALKTWLTYRGSFSKRLHQFTKHPLQIKLITQHYGIPTLAECKYLGFTKKCYALIREVYIDSGNQTWQYARTIIPIENLKENFFRLKRWGKIPIGKFLFSNLAIQRSSFEFAKLKKKDFYYQRAEKILTKKPNSLWARRSLFTLENQALLITEVFLTNFTLNKNER